MDSSGPITRFLPPVPDNVIREIEASLNVDPAWVLDPFGALPHFAVELARSGQRVLVTAGNPVSRFLIDLAATPPAVSNLRAALADLATARKEGKRLETLLQSLYMTRCESCGSELPAEAFVWANVGSGLGMDENTRTLKSKIYNCSCGSGGEFPVSPEDVENAARWGLLDGMHRSRALERVSPLNDPYRSFADEALAFYTPRAVYAIGTMINRLDNLSSNDEHRRCLSALLLYALDYGNSLWSHDSERPRPLQLSFSPLFYEHNIWMALEAGVKFWSSQKKRVPITIWPDEPSESGGLCVFEGPLRGLIPDIKGLRLKAVITVIPRPNQAFWSLSALWAGWLWGHAAVGSFKSVLRRRRYDWQWHAVALKSLFGNLMEIQSTENIPVLGILSEAEPSFLSAVMLSARAAGLELSGYILRNENDTVQFQWDTRRRHRGATSSVPAASLRPPLPLDINYTRKIIREILQEKGEPVSYNHLHIFTLAALEQKNRLSWSDDEITKLEKTIHAALKSPEFIDLDSRLTPETGRWALTKWEHQENFFEPV